MECVQANQSSSTNRGTCLQASQQTSVHGACAQRRGALVGRSMCDGYDAFIRRSGVLRYRTALSSMWEEIVPLSGRCNDRSCGAPTSRSSGALLHVWRDPDYWARSFAYLATSIHDARLGTDHMREMACVPLSIEQR